MFSLNQYLEPEKLSNNDTTQPDLDAARELAQLTKHIKDVYRNITGQEASPLNSAIENVNQIRHHYENIIANLPGHVYWLDTELRYRGSNLLHTKNAGFSNTEEIIGKTNFETLWCAEAHILNKVNKEVMQTGKAVVLEEYETSMYGPKKHYLTHKVPLRDQEGTIIGLLGISMDITARVIAEQSLKEAKEESEQANAAKSKFILNIGHDLRTPLVGIIRLSELLLRDEKDDNKRSDIGVIHDAAERLLDLIQQIIELLKLKDKRTIAQNKFTLPDIVDDVLTMLQAQFKVKNINLITKIALPAKISFLGDAMRVHRILLNIISNSLKFTNKGAITIDISIAEQNSEEMQIKFCITDTGIGIAMDKQGEIFDMFTKLSSSFEGIYTGLGLGLYLTKQFIEDLHGKIWVESEVDKGTTFSVLLPLKPVSPLIENDNEPLKFLEHEQAVDDILIIENNIVGQRILFEILKQFDCHITTTATGEQAYEAAQTKRYDLIIMDLGLEGMDSFTLTKTLRGTDNLNQFTPIVGLTAFLDPATEQQALKSGMNLVLAKPIKLSTCKQLMNLSFADCPLTE